MKAAALQQAIYDALNVSSVTDLLSTAHDLDPAIFSDVEQAADSGDPSYFPFIVIGDGTIAPFDTKDNIGGDARIQINIFTRSTSMIAAREVVDAVDAVIRRQALTISGATHINTNLDTMTPVREPDGFTINWTLLYNVLWLEG